MHQTSHTPPLVLSGINSGNPLGFLAALGAAILAGACYRDLRFYWCIEEGAWRPALLGCGTDRAQFIEQLIEAMKAASMKPFGIDNKLPFSAELFETNLREAQRTSSPTNRRTADFLSGFGSEINPKDGAFQDSRFRMARSGDSKGQGLPAYARVIRRLTNEDSLYRALFISWTYKDIFYEDIDEGKRKVKNVPSFRWDPIDDRRYALRWRSPDQKTGDDVGTELGANSLALEALQWYPTMFQGNQLATTGFHRSSNNEVWFTWPIWDRPITLDVARSLLALSDLHSAQPPRSQLSRRGIVEIYRSQRIQQNKYYSNFTSARPV